MNHQINIRSNSANAVQPQNSGSTPMTDAELQALLDVGQLAFLANTYEDLVTKGASPALISKALAEFQTMYGYYHISGSTVTFDYNEGASPGVAINNPDVIEILQNMPKMASNPPSAADILNFQTNPTDGWNTSGTITWKDGQQQTLVERILLTLYDARYCMQNNLKNTITNTSLILFYCSLVNTPGSIAAGTLDDVLSIGYLDGAMIPGGNIYAFAASLRDHLANDTTLLDPAVIQAGLSIKTQDLLYPILGSTFQMLMALPPESESADWGWESRFFPFYSDADEQRIIDALPDVENTQLQNRIALEKKLMAKHDAPLPVHHHTREQS